MYVIYFMFFWVQILYLNSVFSDNAIHTHCKSKVRQLQNKYLNMRTYLRMVPIPEGSWSKTWVCVRSLAVIAGSNPTGGMDVCLF
jgi:hypothetical protein